MSRRPWLLGGLLLALCGCRPPAADVAGPLSTPAADPPPVATAAAPRSAQLPFASPRSLPVRPVRDSDWFSDIATQAGVRCAYRDGSEAGLYQLIESVGGGGASLDFDRDGLEDLFFTGGGTLALDSGEGGIDVRGRPSVLYRNRAGAGFVDVSRSAHVAGEDLYTHGVTVCDYDADGFDDLVVAGYGGVQVWRNQGDGTAAEVSQGLGIVSEKWNVTAAAADYDNDGLIDLYLLTYADWRPDPGEACLNDQGLRDICGPTLYPGERDVLFRNSGHAFEDVTDEVGLVPANRGLGVVAADFNADGAIDFAVVNDVEENQLYLNGPAGVFRDEALLWGAAYSATGEREGSMGVEAGDYDGDAQLDLWYTNYAQQDNSLLRNVAHNGFVHASGASGLTGVSRQWVGFGTILADFNGDGWDDIFIANGHVAYERRDSPYFQPPQLFRSEAGRRFVDVSGEGGPYFDLAWSGRGAFRTDWDEDGAWDIAVSHQNDPVALLHNRRPPKAWIKLDLIGTATNRDAVGASATVHTAKRSITRWRIGGGSYLSHSDSRLLFALDDPASPIEATIRWPAGAVEIFGPLVPARTHSLVEGRGRHADP